MTKPKRAAELNEDVKIGWKPWLRNVTEPPAALSDETIRHIGSGSRWAFTLMQRTRGELIKMHTEILDPDAVDGLMVHLRETQQWLSATEHMVACAHERVLASAEAAHAKGLKFKGVVDLNGPVPRGKFKVDLNGPVPRGKAVQAEARRVAKSPGISA